MRRTLRAWKTVDRLRVKTTRLQVVEAAGSQRRRRSDRRHARDEKDRPEEPQGGEDTADEQGRVDSEVLSPPALDVPEADGGEDERREGKDDGE